MSTTIALACEDNGHFVAATALVDGVLLARHGWLDGIIESCRAWRGLRPDTSWYKYDPNDANDVRPITIDGQRIQPMGHIGGKPLEPEAGMWRKILLMFCQLDPRPDVVILARDLDGYPGRLVGLNQVREQLPWPFRVVAAVAQPEIEAWHVCGFAPQNDAEMVRMSTQIRRLFDAVAFSHRLTSHPNHAATDAKKVLRELTEGDVDRNVACLADHGRLRANGEHNGVRAFLDEVDQHIVPLFGAAVR